MLSFYDSHRQGYGSVCAPTFPGEFMIGDYSDEGGVSEGGEFAIYLHDLGMYDRSLSAQIRAFDDSGGSLKKFLATGAWDVICALKIQSRDEVSEILLAA